MNEEYTIRVTKEINVMKLHDKIFSTYINQKGEENHYISLKEMTILDLLSYLEYQIKQMDHEKREMEIARTVLEKSNQCKECKEDDFSSCWNCKHKDSKEILDHGLVCNDEIEPHCETCENIEECICEEGYTEEFAKRVLKEYLKALPMAYDEEGHLRCDFFGRESRIHPICQLVCDRYSECCKATKNKPERTCFGHYADCIACRCCRVVENCKTNGIKEIIKKAKENKGNLSGVV